MNLMDNDVWSFFTKTIGESRMDDGLKMRNSEWEWLAQSEDLRSKTIGQIVNMDMDEIVVRMPMRSDVFDLKMKRTDGFPETMPLLTASFIEGFQGLLWKETVKLLDITEEFYKYIKVIDDAIIDIKDACFNGFELENVAIDEEDSAYLMVKLLATEFRETITLSVEYENVRNFPRVLKISNTERMSSFDCERWNSDDCLAENLLKLFRVSDDEENNDPIDAQVQDDSIMDFN